MTNHTCILTTKDFTILEVMRDRDLGSGDQFDSVLRKKIGSAIVMFRDDIPENVATLNSRVTFRINDCDPDTRIISHDRKAATLGMFLPITTARGLALLGLAEGQEIVLTGSNGTDEKIVLEKVLYQPEAARREKRGAPAPNATTPRRPSLKVIRGGLPEEPRFMHSGPKGPDDHGPSAA